ncbi:MAG: hypothetical protein GXZ10_13335 [Gammaproteobacteria bacterium]|nr:hypothetical protein [Gammaproteobacteria bacterium]
MTAKTPAQRMREMRARNKMKEDDRLRKLLAKTIKLQLYHATNEQLERIMLEHDIDEPQDVISRLIAGYSQLTEDQKLVIFN